MLPSTKIAQLEQDLAIERRRSAMFAAKLAVLDVEPEPLLPAWAYGLQPQQAAVCAALLAAYPHFLSSAALEEATRPDHARERDLKIVNQHIHRLRAHFGAEFIENVYGQGWRLSAEGRHALAA